MKLKKISFLFGLGIGITMGCMALLLIHRNQNFVEITQEVFLIPGEAFCVDFPIEAKEPEKILKSGKSFFVFSGKQGNDFIFFIFKSYFNGYVSFPVFVPEGGIKILFDEREIEIFPISDNTFVIDYYDYDSS